MDASAAFSWRAPLASVEMILNGEGSLASSSHLSFAK